MGNLVIVALPEEDDLVWKVSSEKKPHLTLMYLGEASEANNVDRMAEFVEHALNISEHGPFYMDVEYRGELGDDKADVLFFRNGWDSKWIKSLRGQLLQHADIRRAYEANDQYPEWVPHLTLGYPATPAKPVPDDRKIYSVCFDRIAVWAGDYEGPEFRLRWPVREEELVVAYGEVGQEAVEDILEHFGVKGMRWGVRKKPPSVIAKPKNHLTKGQTAALVGLGSLIPQVNKGFRENLGKNQIENAKFQMDRKWEKDFQKAKGFGFDDTKFTKNYNEKWKDHDFSNVTGADLENPKSAYNRYVDGYFKEMNREYAKQFAAHYGESPSGRYEAYHVPGTDLVKLRAKATAQHSVEDGVLVTFRIFRDEKGLITKLEQVEEELAQTAMYGEVFAEGLLDGLAHYGVKGMRWGIRKETPSPVVPTATVKVPHGNKRKTKIQVEGGENHPAAEDAIRVAQARAKLAKSGPAALTNRELREIADRMRLEEQVATMTRSSGSRFVRKVLQNQGNQAANQAVKSEIDARIFKKNK